MGTMIAEIAMHTDGTVCEHATGARDCPQQHRWVATSVGELKLTTTVTMPLDVEAQDIDMMIDTNIYRDSSPWIGRITRYADSGTGLPYWKVWYDGLQDDEGSFESKVRVTRQQLLDGFARAATAQWQGKHSGLCCLDEMLRDKSLAIGCAQDSDMVMQFALLGDDAPVYG